MDVLEVSDMVIRRARFVYYALTVFVLVFVAVVYRSVTCGFHTSTPALGGSSSGRVCFIARTSVREDHDGPEGLERFMSTIEQLNYKNWTVLLVHADMRPYPGLKIRPQERRGDFRVLKLPAQLQETPFRKGTSAMDRADYALTQCPPDTRWVIVTNGDNEYFPDALDHLDPEYDIVAVDFLSRHSRRSIQTTSAIPTIFIDTCSSFFRSSCINNQPKVGETDCGANFLNWPRLMTEGFLFMNPKYPLTDEQDGLMIEDMMETGTWRRKHISRCLMVHNPNPWSCCRNGGAMRGHKCDYTPKLPSQVPASIKAPNHRLTHHNKGHKSITYEPSELELRWVQRLKDDPSGSKVCEWLASEVEDVLAYLNVTETYNQASQREGFLFEKLELTERQEKLFSRFHYEDGRVELIEPLVGILREPRGICPGLPKREPCSREFLLPMYSFGTHRSTVAILDAGASTWSDFNPAMCGASQQYLYQSYTHAGGQVTQMQGWDLKPLKPVEIFLDVPAKVLPFYQYFNVALNANRTSKFYLWDYVMALSARVDAVSVKLDIDHPVIERDLVRDLLGNQTVQSVLTEFFFEHHSNVNAMKSFWGPMNPVDNLGRTYEIMTQLREAGIRAHSWP